MSDWVEWASRAPVIKWAVIVGFAFLSALMQRDMNLLGRSLTVIAGIFAAVVFAEPLILFFELDAAYGNAVAAVLALTGRNWTAVAIRATRDPVETLSRMKSAWWGKPRK